MTLKLGDTVRYIKTHEGHLCRVTGTAENSKGDTQWVSVRCQCGAALWLRMQDVEKVLKGE